ncbi:Blue-light-activated protein [bacterium HR23]|nr:Blue-light-activated protein [bacterium HR23]
MTAPGLDDLLASGGAERLLRAIAEVAFVNLSRLPSPAVMERLAGIVGEGLGARAVVVRRYDPHRQVLEAVASWGIPLADLPYPALPVQREERLYSVNTVAVVYTADLQDDPIAHTVRERLGIETTLAVPLRTADTYLGTLRLHFRERRTFTPEETALVQAVGDRLALALHHLEALEREQGARRQAEALLAIARAGLANAPLEEILQGLASAIRQALRADSTVIRLWDEESQGLVLGASDPHEFPGWGRPSVILPMESFSGRVFTENRTLILADIHSDPTAHPRFPPQFRSTMGTPLPGEERPVGVIHVEWKEPHTPTPQEQVILEMAASLAAQAVRKTQALEREQGARRQAEALLAIARAGLANAPLQDILQGLSRAIYAALGADRVVIRLWNEEEQSLDLAAFTPALLSHLLRPRHRSGEKTFSLRVFQERRTIALPDIESDPVAQATFHPSLVSTLGTPIPDVEKPLGVIHADWTTRHVPTPAEQALLEMAAGLAGQAILRARALEREESARRWAEALADVLERATRPGPLPQVLQGILEGMAHYWDAPGGIIRLVDRDANCLNAVACIGYRLEDLAPQPVDGSGGGFSHRIFTTGATGVFGYSELVQAGSFIPRFGYRQMLGAVLRVRGEAVGVIHLDWKEERIFTPQDIERFTLMVGLASQAVERAWLYEETSRQAQALQESNRALRFQAVILGQVQDAICATDRDGKVRYWGPGAEALLGVPAPSAQGKPLYALLGYTAEEWAECVRRVEQGEIPATRSVRYAHPQGKALWLDLAISPWYGEGGGLDGFIVVGRDVTRVRQMEVQMLQLEKMRALGQMAAGVAHDFNNFLAVIMGQAELALMDRTLSPRLQQALEAIRRASVDGAQVVRRLATLARLRAEGQPEPVDAQKVCRDALESTRFAWEERSARQGIAIHLDLDLQEVPPLACTESELREVLINLILNAIDAMPQGGTLGLACFQDGGQVCIAVKDTGIGISPQVRQHLFEPFFTTKGPRGTGLGLAVSYSIVKRYGGDITVESAVGKGSTFTVRLPIAPSPREKETPKGESIPAGRSLRLLVVEDDPAVADLLEDMLHTLGHHPQVFRDPTQALEAIGSGEWDAVLTDLAMPGVSGWEVAQHSKKVRPMVPVLLLTGYGDHIDPQQARAHGVDGILGKPVSARDMAIALQALVEGGGVRVFRQKLG